MDYLAFCAFKKKLHFKSKADFLIEFEKFLKHSLQHQRNFVLILDEAQNFSFEVLEEIRLLSNMETADEKLINIFLVGQPELNEKLRQPRCKSLLQRISIRHHIKPLDLIGTQEYIGARLKFAGAQDGDKIFPKHVTRSIYEYSQGYPRMINVISDNALLLGYSRGVKKITPAIVKDCYDDMKLEPDQLDKGGANRKHLKVKHVKPAWPGRYWKWAAVLLAVLLVVFLNTGKGQETAGRLVSHMEILFQRSPQEVTTRQVVPIEQDSSVKEQEEVQDVLEAAVKEVGEVTEPPEKEVDAQENPNSTPPVPVETAGVVKTSVPEETEASWTTIVVKEGDTLTAMALNVYGQADENIISLVQKHNPQLEDINLLVVGQKIVFPPLSSSSPGPVFTVHIASFEPFQPALDMFKKLMNEGYEAYIMPVYDAQKGKFFRVTLGNFKSEQEAKAYADTLLQDNVSDYAKAMRLEMR
jgi:phage tail protein X